MRNRPLTRLEKLRQREARERFAPVLYCLLVLSMMTLFFILATNGA